MSKSEYRSSDLGKSAYSTHIRKQVLWNVVQPGDPYDIRKSTIARFPGAKNNFMGSNLQIICLFQSAQIQRLSEFLDDYKFRYRQIERIQLDRHSYEIQIKQLTHQLASQGSFKSQNLKLKDFIKKQATEIQELKNGNYTNDDVKYRYSEALRQIQNLMSDNTQARHQIEDLRLEMNNYKTKIQIIQSTKNQQIQRIRIQSSSRQKSSYQMNSMKQRYEGEIQRLQYQQTRLRQSISSKNGQINDLLNKNKYLIRELQDLENQRQKNSSYNNSNNFEDRVTLLSQQIQRLNMILNQSTLKIDEVSRNQLLWQDKYRRRETQFFGLEEHCQQLQVAYRELQQKYQSHSSSLLNQSKQQYDQSSRVYGLQQQIRRLGQQLGSKQNQYNRLQQRYQQLQYNSNNLRNIERQNHQLKNQIKHYEQLKIQMVQYQNRIAMLSQQIQRLTIRLESSGNRNRQHQEIQHLKRKSLENQKRITQKFELEIQRRVKQYQGKLSMVAKQSNFELQSKLRAINQEVERLNIYLQEKTEESENNKRKIKELQNSMHQKYDIDYKRKQMTYENSVRQLQWNNEQLNRKIRELDSTAKRIPEYENKIAIMGQQIDRLKSTLQTKNQEYEKATYQYKQLDNKVKNVYEIESSRKISMYEENQNQLMRENQQLQRRLQDIIELNRKLSESENRHGIMNQQIQRLNHTLKSKVELLNQVEGKNRELNYQIQKLSKNRIEMEQSYIQRFQTQKMESSRRLSNFQQNSTGLQRENEELKRKLNQYSRQYSSKFNQTQSKISNSNQQIERLNQNLNKKNNQYNQAEINLRNQNKQIENLRREVRDLQTSITQKYEVETSKKISNYEHNMNTLNRQLDQLRRKLQQFDRTYKQKNEEVIQSENKYRTTVQEFELFRRQVKEYQNDTTKTKSSLEHNLTNYTRQMDELKRVLRQYQNKLSNSSQQIERLRSQHKNYGQQNENLRRTITEMKTEITQKYQVQTSRKISTYEQNLNSVNRERQDLRRQIGELENVLTKQNRELEETYRKNSDLENKLKRLQSQFQLFKNNLSNKSQQDYKSFQHKSRQYQQQIETWRSRYQELQMTVTQKYQVQTSRKVSNYEQNLQNLGRELQNARNKVVQLERIRSSQENQLNKQNNKLRSQAEQNQRLIHHIKQLEMSITQKYEIQVTKKYTTYEQNIQILSNQLQEMKRKVVNSQQNMYQTNEQQSRNIQQLQRIKIQLQNKNKSLSEQLQRTNLNFRNKNQQLRNLIQQLEMMRRQMKQNEINITKKYQYQSTQVITNLQKNIHGLNKQNQELRRRLVDSEGKIALLTQQLERININFKQKMEEYEHKIRNYNTDIDKYKHRIQQVEYSSTQKLQMQISKKSNQFQQNLTTRNRQFQSLRTQSNNRYKQYQQKISMLTQQIERLNNNLRTKVQQINKMQYKLRGTHEQFESFSRKQKQNQKISSQRINSQYKIYVEKNQRKLSDYENRINLLTQQIQRLNANLKNKVDQLNNIQRNVLPRLRDENQSLRRNIKQNEIAFSQKYQTDISRKVSSYEQNISMIKSEKQTYIRKIDDITRGNSQLQNKLAILTQQIDRLNQVLKTKVEEADYYKLNCKNMQTQLSRYQNQRKVDSDQHSNILKQRTQQIRILQARITQIQTSHSSGSQQFRQLKTAYDLLTKEYDGSKKHLHQYEGSVKKLYLEFERLQGIINQLKIERQVLFEKNQGLSQQIDRLTVENRDQESQLYQIRIRLADESALHHRINQQLTLMVVLFAEIETLRQRVSDKEKEVKQVRRSSLAPLKVVGKFE